LVNQGLIDSDVTGTITIDGTGWANSGTIQSSGGTLDLDGEFSTAGLGDFRTVGGLVRILGDLDNTGDTFALDATTGSPQFLGSITGGTVTTTGGSVLLCSNGLLDGVTLGGTVEPLASGSVIRIRNGVTLNGAIDGSTKRTVVRFVEAAQTLAGTGEIIFNDNTNLVTTAGTLTIGPGVTIRGGRAVLGSTGFDIINSGTIRSESVVPSLTFRLDGSSWSNSGTLEGGYFESNAPLSNSATLSVGTNGGFIANDSYVQTAGTTDLGPNAVLTLTQPLDLQGGALTGFGTIQGDVDNQSLVAPGASAGTLTNNGSYSQDPVASLDIELGGALAGEFDQLVVTGATTLSGTLNVTLINAFAPAGGDGFPIVQHAGATGTFTTENLPPLSGGRPWMWSTTRPTSPCA
jgi:hypothetical protein